MSKTIDPEGLGCAVVIMAISALVLAIGYGCNESSKIDLEREKFKHSISKGEIEDE